MQHMKKSSSLLNKFILVFVSLAAVIVLLVLITISMLQFMKNQINFREATSLFYESVLDARRSEKNYFMFYKNSDYEENIRTLARAGELINSNRFFFEHLSGQTVFTFSSLSERYVQMMSNHHHGLTRGKPGDPAAEPAIRLTGQQLLNAAGIFNRNETKYLHAGINRLILFSLSIIAVLAGLCIIIIVIASKKFFAPLKQIEAGLNVITEGGINKINIQVKDQEINSLIDTVNKMVQELEEKKWQLVHSEKIAALGAMLSGITHEINNPVSNISTSVDILKSGTGKKKSALEKKIIGQIEGEIERIRKIIGIITGFSQKKNLKMTWTALNLIIQETYVLLKKNIPEDIDLQIKINRQLYIKADKSCMQQVFINLLKNSADAIGSRKGRITIFGQLLTIKNPDDFSIFYKNPIPSPRKIPGRYIEIQITDSGPGIRENMQNKIFEPFFTTKKNHDNMGLGLYIINEIIREHQGEIFYNNSHEKSGFVILLPARDDQ